jgi:hypothetical protein
VIRHVTLRHAISISTVVLAAGCGAPTPPRQGFGAECQFSADCGDGYVCLDATCVPDDVEAPDPIGDGDGDVDGTLTSVTFERARL